ncbi:MAG: hypothetical protein HZB35_06480 [Nitrospirae bacterium]|nr:hypothetical protein [Nitrospirota bacterium]
MFLTLAGCVAGPLDAPYRTSKHLIGLSEEALLSCAGTPMLVKSDEEGRLLVYRGKADALEALFPASKGGLPCPQAICEALVTVRGSRVTAVKYRTDPLSRDECYRCERMFEACFQ